MGFLVRRRKRGLGELRRDLLRGVRKSSLEEGTSDGRGAKRNGGAANRTPDRLYAKEELYH
jgi:hypothetical protein